MTAAASSDGRKQPTIRTVQGEIERVLHTITRVPVDDPAEPLRLTVAGRTDTGVHASHQSAISTSARKR